MGRVLLLAMAMSTLGMSLVGSGDGAGEASARQVRILVFTKTTGFRHASIPAALRTVRALGASSGLAVDATEDARAFSSANLARYRAVVFLLTTGDVLNAAQQSAFERFIRAGNGYAGVHSAADTEPDWAWYDRLLGTHFRTHPQIQRAVVRVAVEAHPSTAALPRSWPRVDEWYGFTRDPRPSVRVLATLDESTYSPGDSAMGADHPIAWAHAFDGGRAWYTGGGHTDESYAEPLFRRHLLGGIRYAAGLSPPRIARVGASIRRGRLALTVRYATCVPCAGQLLVAVSGRTLRARLTFDGRIGRVTSPQLPPGRWGYTVVLRDPLTGLRDTVRRTAVVR